MLWAVISFAMIVALIISMQPIGKSATSQSALQASSGRRLGMAGAILVPVLAVAIYTQLAPSGTPSQAPSLADGLSLPPAEQPQGGTGQQEGLPDVDTMVERLAARLKDNPSDVKGWKMLGWSYTHLDRKKDAIEAYRHVVSIAPSDADAHARLAEALVGEAGDQVTPDARKEIDAALAIDGKEPRALYLTGLWQDQQGQSSTAFETWKQLLASSDLEADWVPALKQKLEALARKLGKDPAPYASASAPPPATMPSFGGAGLPGNPHAVTGGPSPADVAAANAMSPESRTQMVNGMVEGLVEKLRQNPKILDGWLMLARSRMVLGDANAARTAIGRAREIFAGDSTALEQISAAERDIGLTP